METGFHSLNRLALRPAALAAAWLLCTALLLLEAFFGVPGHRIDADGEARHPYDRLRAGRPDWWG